MTGSGAPAAGPAPPLPGWLGPIVTITTQVGVPTVVAGVLLWFVLTRVDNTMQVIQEEEESRTRIVAAMQDTMIAAFDRQTKSFVDAIADNIRANQQVADQQHQERVRLLEKLEGPR